MTRTRWMQESRMRRFEDLYERWSGGRLSQCDAAENMALRQQVPVLNRRARGRLPIRSLDRRVLSWLCRFQPSALAAIIIVKPETVARWHRAGFRRFWTWKSRKRTGRLRKYAH